LNTELIIQVNTEFKVKLFPRFLYRSRFTEHSPLLSHRSHRRCLHGDATVLESRTKDPPSYHAVGQNNASPSCFMVMFTVADLSYNHCVLPPRIQPAANYNELQRTLTTRPVIIIIVCYAVSQSTAASSASCKRSRPPSNLVNGQTRPVNRI